MAIVASIYLRFYIEVRVGVSTFLLMLTPQLRFHSPVWNFLIQKC
jgi:hypothetical protein